jgi:hypothetical protein
MSVRGLLDLPSDVLSSIVMKLPVHDRVRFGIAQGKKALPELRKEQERNRNLYIMHKDLKKLPIQQGISSNIMNFVKNNVKSWDTTFEDVADKFSELKRENLDKLYDTDYEYLPAKLMNYTQGIHFNDVVAYYKKATPAQFDVLVQHAKDGIPVTNVFEMLAPYTFNMSKTLLIRVTCIHN